MAKKTKVQAYREERDMLIRKIITDCATAGEKRRVKKVSAFLRRVYN